MPIDLRCPGCAATIPVTEAGSPSAVECPYCEHEFDQKDSPKIDE